MKRILLFLYFGAILCISCTTNIFAQNTPSLPLPPSLSEIEKIHYIYPTQLPALDCRLDQMELQYYQSLAHTKPSPTLSKLETILQSKRIYIDTLRSYIDSLYYELANVSLHRNGKQSKEVLALIDKSLLYNRFYTPSVLLKIEILQSNCSLDSSFWQYLQICLSEQYSKKNIRFACQHVYDTFLIQLKELNTQGLFNDALLNYAIYKHTFPAAHRFLIINCAEENKILTAAHQGLFGSYCQVSEKAFKQGRSSLSEKYALLANTYYLENQIYIPSSNLALELLTKIMDKYKRSALYADTDEKAYFASRIQNIQEQIELFSTNILSENTVSNNQSITLAKDTALGSLSLQSAIVNMQIAKQTLTKDTALSSLSLQPTIVNMQIAKQTLTKDTALSPLSLQSAIVDMQIAKQTLAKDTALSSLSLQPAIVDMQIAKQTQSLPILANSTIHNNQTIQNHQAKLAHKDQSKSDTLNKKTIAKQAEKTSVEQAENAKIVAILNKPKMQVQLPKKKDMTKQKLFDSIAEKAILAINIRKYSPALQYLQEASDLQKKYIIHSTIPIEELLESTAINCIEQLLNKAQYRLWTNQMEAADSLYQRAEAIKNNYQSRTIAEMNQLLASYQEQKQMIFCQKQKNEVQYLQVQAKSYAQTQQYTLAYKKITQAALLAKQSICKFPCTELDSLQTEYKRIYLYFALKDSANAYLYIKDSLSYLRTYQKASLYFQKENLDNLAIKHSALLDKLIYEQNYPLLFKWAQELWAQHKQEPSIQLSQTLQNIVSYLENHQYYTPAYKTFYKALKKSKLLSK